MSDLTPGAGLTNRLIGGTESRRVLIVDDEETIRLALSRFLRGRGYEVETADSGEGALARLQAQRFSVMLSDVRMPGMTGIQLVPRARALQADLAVIMLSALNDVPTATESIGAGAMEYLTKPIDLPDLLAAVERVAHRRDLAVEQANVERLIDQEVTRRLEGMRQAQATGTAAALEAMARLVALHEARDPFRAGSSVRVAAIAGAMAEVLGMGRAGVQQVELAARLHDVGHLALRDAVLNKPGALTAEEMDHVREHVRIAIDLLAPLGELGEVLSAIADHHEHWDGSGYPGNLVGEQIALGGRILCCADAFVALTSRRPYRPAMAAEDTVDYLAAHAGGLLDPRAYTALRTVVAERRVLGLVPG